MNRLFISILFSAGILFAQHNIKYEWKNILEIGGENLTFHWVESESNFIVKNGNGDLFAYKKGKIRKIKSPVSENFTNPKFASINKETAVMALMDKNWMTHFYFLRKMKWRKCSFIYKLPIQKIIVVNENIIYAVGNFGSLLKYRNGKWKVIELHLKTHINFAEVLSADSLYILAQNEGLFRFNGVKLIPVKSELKWENRFSMFKRSNRIFIYSKFQGYFEIIRDSLVKRRMKDIPVKFIRNELGQYSGYFEFTNGKIKSINFPENFRFTDSRIIDNNKLLSTTATGEVLLGMQTTKIFFTESAKNYGLLGTPEANNLYEIAGDFNGDDLTDIYLVALHRRWQIDLYENRSDRPFELRSDIIRTEAKQSIIQFRAADFDGDQLRDILLLTDAYRNAQLKIYADKAKGFELIAAVDLPLKIIKAEKIFLTPTDIDADGDLDIAVTSYYGYKDNPGSVFFLINKYWGTDWELDTSYIPQTSGWNISSLFADFDGDGLNDWLISNKWRKTKLFMQRGNVFVDESNKRLEGNVLSEDYAAVSFDFDNDGDLDIFLTSDQQTLKIYENNGKGYFSDITVSLLESNILTKHKTGQIMQLNSGDFNNDGFTDLFLSYGAPKPSVMLLINRFGKRFVDKTEEFKISSDAQSIYCVGDLNKDGDLDIYQLTYGANKFWENNAADNNFIEIIPKGILSNSDAIGTKVWLFKNDSLVGYKQIGGKEFGYYSQSDLIVHFGVEPNSKYKAVVQFYGGAKIERDKIEAGSIVVIPEAEGLKAFLILLPGRMFRVVADEEIQMYSAVIIISVLIIFTGIRFGSSKYKWGNKLITLLISVNLSLTWVILLLTINSNSIYLKYLFPVAAAFVGALVPHLFFYISRKQLGSPESKEKMEEELLQLLISFSHGEWALRSLNSLQLFFINFSEVNLASNKYLAQLMNRIDTFLDLTQININRVIKLCEKLELDTARNDELKSTLAKIVIFLNRVKGEKAVNNIEDYLFTDCGNNFKKLKDLISDIRLTVYSDFSCSIFEVVEKFTELYEKDLEERGIKLEVVRENEVNTALVKPHELIDALDNLMTNAIRAVENSRAGNITIMIKNVTPKIHINFADSGAGIDKQIWKDIFERGYSTRGSTGEGLYQAKSMIEKYGGRIYVKSSSADKGTVFTIELNEGIKK